jgi:hypothetical protein
MIAYSSPPLPKRNPLRSQRIKTKEPSLDEILEDICFVFEQPIDGIKSPRQLNDYVICRRIYIYVSHVLTNKSIGSISSLINKDHSCCLNHLRKCFGFFSINESGFMSEWHTYLLKSKIWNEYYLIRKKTQNEQKTKTSKKSLC